MTRGVRKATPTPHLPAGNITPAAIGPGGLLEPYGFRGASWGRWIAVLKAAYGEALTPEERALFVEVAERDPPTAQVSEPWCIVGRRGGKDSVASALATVAALGDYTHQLRPGERAAVGIVFMRHEAIKTRKGGPAYHPWTRQVHQRYGAALSRHLIIASTNAAAWISPAGVPR